MSNWITAPMRAPRLAGLFALSALAASAALAVEPAGATGDAAQARVVTGKTVRPPGPAWLDHAVFYQIYPQTFYDSNGDGIGDLPGIIAKLDYVKSLGAGAIWLNPFHESPFRDAGYDASDFYTVAPRYGTNEDARRLFAEAHKRGLRVVFDYVISYTSIDHPWFKASCDPKPNKYSNWYVWTNGTWYAGWDLPKNRAGFIQGYCERDAQFLSNFFWHQPALNFGYAHPDPASPWQLPTNHPDVLALKEELKNVLRFWLEMGADGFRADMAGSLVKNDDGTETSKFWRELRELMDREYPGRFMVAEWSDPKAATAGGFHADFLHWFQGYDDLFQKEKHRRFGNDGHSFFDAEGLGDISHFLKIYLDQYDGSRARGYVALPFGNHDLQRIKNSGRTDRDLEVIFAFALTMPGTPFVYYGDEIGMRQLDNLPHTEGSYGGRAGDRTPMQWTSGVNKGFSFASPERLYRAVDAAADAPSVAAQEKDPASLLNEVRSLIRLHNEEPALAAYAEFVPVFAEKEKYPFAFVRANGKDRLLVVLNPAGREVSATFTLTYASQKPVLIAGSGSATLGAQDVTVKLGPVAYAVFRVNAAR